jgi:hypothetical protein
MKCAVGKASPSSWRIKHANPTAALTIKLSSPLHVHMGNISGGAQARIRHPSYRGWRMNVRYSSFLKRSASRMNEVTTLIIEEARKP